MTAQSGLSTQNTALFGVSALGNRWEWRTTDERSCLAISQRYRLPELVARLLVGRGVSLDEAQHYLSPSLKTALPDPSCLKDMDAAAERLAGAVMSGEVIGIFGDYDVDGATSTAVLTRFFSAVGAKSCFHIPDRIDEGYGPNLPAFLDMQRQGAGVIITVDCGAVAFEPIAAARDAGIDIIVADHHIGEVELPPAYAVVNPNRFDEDRSLGQLAAVGVTFLLVVALNRLLRQQGWYATRNEPDLRQWLDLVALGTVCDVVPLTGINRVYVAQGLKVMAGRRNTGLAALADVAGLDDTPSVYHAGFMLGPRINAGGRVGEASMGARLLACEDAIAARQMAETLDRHNAERKTIEAAVLEEAIAQVEQGAVTAPLLWAVGEGWHPGVIGIAAGRIKERYNRPVAVIALDKGIGKASCRSIAGVDFGTAVSAAKASGLLLAGGGHAMAAGFSVEESHIDELHAFLSGRLAPGVAVHGAVRTLHLDGMIAPSALHPAMATQIEQAGPYGMGNPSPRFVLGHCRLVKAELVGKDHIRVMLTDAEAAGRSGARWVKAMAFRSMGTPLGDQLLSAQGKTLHCAGHLRINRWMGNESVEMTVEDIMLL